MKMNVLFWMTDWYAVLDIFKDTTGIRDLEQAAETPRRPRALHD